MLASSIAETVACERRCVGLLRGSRRVWMLVDMNANPNEQSIEP
jgi:hypothetical protein